IDQIVRGQDARGNDRRSSRLANRTVVQLNEVGGIVLSATWDSVSYQNALPQITGRVVVERTGTPLDGVVVSLVGTHDTVRTDAEGRFEVRQVIPGRYTLIASDTAFAAYGFARDVSSAIAVASGRSTDVVLAIASRSVTMSRICDGQRVPERSTIMLGTLVADALFAFRGLSVTSDWFGDATVTGDGRTTSASRGAQVTDVNDKGKFRICGIPAERRVKITLRRDGRPVADTVLTSPAGGRAFTVQWPFIKAPPRR
ncbi:MAG: carboxypeptidase regulatory-like domain-containing protein, partial [bacterium]